MMRIGELATRAGVSTRALRYYEEQRLLEPERTRTGHRMYAEADVARVQIIQELFTAGLNSRLLVRLLPAIDAGHLKPALLERLETEHARLESEIAELQAAHRRLAVLIKLSTHPVGASCPTTLDEAASGESAPVTNPIRPKRHHRSA
jgi:DNA-binding transcriptional MerR regulator